jgi:hypothetical protein
VDWTYDSDLDCVAAMAWAQWSVIENATMLGSNPTLDPCFVIPRQLEIVLNSKKEKGGNFIV